MTLRRGALLLSTALALAACGSSPQEGPADDAAADGPVLDVAAGLYPLELLARRVGADGASVEGLSPPGAEPHDLELTPRQVAALSEADLVLYLKGFQPAVDEAVAQRAPDRALDLAAVNAQGEDPHVWLDPMRYAELADAVAERMGQVAPDRAADFAAAAAQLRAELEQLDEDFRTGLADCEREQFVTSHDAFGYLARAYDLEQVPVTGLTPEDEPSPGRLAEVADLAREAGVTTVFFEDTASPKVAEALASEVGATAAVLSPLETAPEQGDYFTAMRANLAALQDALGCSRA
jgi:zinc transport system substrate-binding protein